MLTLLATLVSAIHLTCTTEPLTTSLVVFTKGSDVTVRLIHHNGVETIPLSRGVVTPYELPALAKRAEVLRKLGNQYDIHIDSSRCLIVNEKVVSCYSAIDQTINGLKISYFSFDTSLATIVSPLSQEPYSKLTANFQITIDGSDYQFAVEYSANRCLN